MLQVSDSVSLRQIAEDDAEELTVLIDRNGIVRLKAPGAVADGGAISPSGFMAQLDRLVRGQA